MQKAGEIAVDRLIALMKTYTTSGLGIILLKYLEKMYFIGFFLYSSKIHYEGKEYSGLKMLIETMGRSTIGRSSNRRLRIGNAFDFLIHLILDLNII